MALNLNNRLARLEEAMAERDGDGREPTVVILPVKEDEPYPKGSIWVHTCPRGFSGVITPDDPRYGEYMPTREILAEGAEQATDFGAAFETIRDPRAMIPEGTELRINPATGVRHLHIDNGRDPGLFDRGATS